ncbi:MAG: type II toxin-antitoxin system VapC family toxin [Rubrivivax sp.]|nr:type II toxin-antitoxin system VapC family toxin [Rubrivivax sp.]
MVDASVSAAWFLSDEATPYTEAALEATTDRDIWFPEVWSLEICNLLLSAQRRRRIDDAKCRQLVARAQALRVRVDHEAVTMATIDELAARHALSAYDAAYLELALRRRLPVATADKALLAAMRVSGVENAAFSAS